MTAWDYVRIFSMVLSIVVMGFSVYVMRRTGRKYDELLKLTSRTLDGEGK